MADTPVHSAVTTLQVHRVDSISNWAGAARLLQEAAERGEDLSPYLNVIRQAYRESQQLQVMTPLAAALTIHYLHRNEQAALRQCLSSSEFGPYIVEALVNQRQNLTTEQLIDLMPALPLSHGRWSHFLALVCRGNPKLTRTLLETIWNEPTTRPLMPQVLRQMVQDGLRSEIDSELSTLYLMTALEGAQALEAAQTLRWLTEADLPMNLPTRFDHENAEVERLLAYCYSFQSGLHGNWTRLDGRWSTPARLGACQALGVLVQSRKVESPELLIRLVSNLNAPEESVRKVAWQALQGRAASLNEVELEGPEWSEEKACFAYEWMNRNPARTARILKGNPPPRLARACQEALAGRHRWGCSICRSLPRSSQVDYESDLPLNLGKLEPQQPYTSSGLRNCPECSAAYQVTCTHEIDDLQSVTQIRVERKATAEPDPALLEHFEQYLRQDTAFALATRASRKKDWASLRALISSQDCQVREHALQAIPGLTNDELIPSLEKQLEVSPRSCQLLFHYLAEAGRARELSDYLFKASPNTAGQILAAVTGRRNLETSHLARQVRDLVKHPDQKLRIQAVAALSWLVSVDQDRPADFDLFRQLLDHSDPETRGRALRGLESLTEFWEKDQSLCQAVSRSLRSDRANRSACLAIFSRLESPLDSAPTLVDILLHDRDGNAQAAAVILRNALQRGQYQAELVKMLAPGWKLEPGLRVQVSHCYQLMSQQGVDLSSVLPDLEEAMLVDGAGYAESHMVKDLTRFLISKGKLVEVKPLLLADTEVSAATCQALTQESVDLEPLLRVLCQLLSHHHYCVSENALRALEAQARQYGKPAVEQALIGAEPSEALSRLESELARLK